MSGAELQPYTLALGASWLTPEGRVLPIPAFHEEWMREHPEVAQGSRNVCELILRTGWISVVLFSGGYVELMVPSRSDGATVDLLLKFLARNAGCWSKALVMSMDEEGYAMLEPRDVESRQALAARLGSEL